MVILIFSGLVLLRLWYILTRLETPWNEAVDIFKKEKVRPPPSVVVLLLSLEILLSYPLALLSGEVGVFPLEHCLGLLLPGETVLLPVHLLTSSVLTLVKLRIQKLVTYC